MKLLENVVDVVLESLLRSHKERQSILFGAFKLLRSIDAALSSAIQSGLVRSDLATRLRAIYLIQDAIDAITKEFGHNISASTQANCIAGLCLL